MTVTEQLAEFIVDTDLEKMPAEVIRLTKNALLDTIGVALAGSVHPVGQAITAFVERFGCRQVSTVIGSNVHTSSPLAALANGTISHVLDYDDHSIVGTQGHTSAVLVPVVLSLGEEVGTSGERLIEAYVLGMEIWAKIANIMPMLHLKGWHPTSVLGTVGAAVASAKLMKLTVEQTTMALGMASSQAAGLVQNFGTMTKPLHVGNAAQNGIVAALLARDGFTAARDIMEGNAGFPLTLYGKGLTDTSRITENLGKPFALLSPGIYLKRYPSCGATHRILDAMLHLIDLYDIKPEDVEAVECQIHPMFKKILPFTEPVTALEGKFSVQFAMAAALTDRKFGMSQVTDEKVNDPVIRSLMKRVSCNAHSDLAEEESTPDTCADIVTVRLKKGNQFSKEVLAAKGSPKYPLSYEELLTKYRECAQMVLTNEKSERCIELVEKLEYLGDIKELMSALSS